MNLSVDKSKCILAFCILCLQMVMTLHCFGTSYSASANGNWNNSSTWSVGRVPADYDTITVPNGITVTVNIVTGQYTDMKVNVDGVLHFNGGKKLNMCDGRVDVSVGGLIIADNAGSKIVICNNTVWDGSDPGAGALALINPGALPVQLTSFTASIVNSHVQLNWSTASEINNFYFSIERSRNLVSVVEVAKVLGAGNSTSTLYYSATDDNPYGSVSYYRLKQVDYDGHVTYSRWVRIVRQNETGIRVMPNPVNGNTVKIMLPGIPASSYHLFINDMKGKLIYDKNINEDLSNDVVSIADIPFRSSGLYYVNVEINGIIYHEKISVDLE